MALAEPPSNPLASVTCRLQLAGHGSPISPNTGGFRSGSFSVFASLFFPVRMGSARRISTALLRHFSGAPAHPRRAERTFVLTADSLSGTRTATSRMAASTNRTVGPCHRTADCANHTADGSNRMAAAPNRAAGYIQPHGLAPPPHQLIIYPCG